MNEVCTNRTRYSFDDAARYIARVSESSPRNRLSYAVAGPCATCRSWHVRIVERTLQLAS